MKHLLITSMVLIGLLGANLKAFAGDGENGFVVPETGNSIFIPNAFTPDGDGRNDVWKPFVNGAVQNFDLSVYSRNGDLLYHTNNPGASWTGNFGKAGYFAPATVYVWFCTIQFENDPVVRKLKGFVTELK